MREHEEREMAVSDVIPPIKEGIEPVIELDPILKNTIFVKTLKVSGIDPTNLLKSRFNTVSDSKLPNEGGIDPTREFLDNCNTRNDVNALIALGIVPEKEQRERKMLVNDVIPPIKDGIEPVIELYAI